MVTKVSRDWLMVTVKMAVMMLKQDMGWNLLHPFASPWSCHLKVVTGGLL